MATQFNEKAKRKLISVTNYVNFVHKCYSQSIRDKYKLVQLPNFCTSVMKTISSYL